METGTINVADTSSPIDGASALSLSSAAEQSVTTARASGKGYGARGAAGALEVPDALADITGKKYYAVGSKDDLENHPVVAEAYEKVPKTQRAVGHAKCAEASGCTQILNDFEAATGTKVTTIEEARRVLSGTRSDIRETANVKGPKSPKKACSSCEPTLGTFEVEDVNKGK